MKTKLLLLLSLCYGISSAQTPIATFNSAPMSNFTIVNSSPAIDQSPTGANVTWSFNNLTAAGTNIDTYAAPTAAQITTYPGTTEVQSTTTQGSTPTVSNVFIKEDMTGTSLTGATQGDFTLNYSTTNAFIGLFPLNFGYNNTGAPVAGTFEYQGTNGTFTGTLTITVEAYGTLNLNDTGTGSYNGNITRLRLDQSLSFSVPPIFNNVGTLTQTSYYYYDNTTNDLIFRYNNATIVSAFLGVNETIEVLERNALNTLSTPVTERKIFQLYPNPVEDYITILTNTTEVVKQINIVNTTGQVVLKTNKDITSLSVTDLPAGLYFISIETKSGKTTTKKFIKK